MTEVVTIMVVLSDEADIMPSQLLYMAQTANESLEMKETCYGLIIQGEKSKVTGVVDRLREQIPYSIFCKERGFFIGDKTRCRTGMKDGWRGAARPGYHQLKRESKMLMMVGKAIEAVDNNDEINQECKMNEMLDEDTIRLMIQRIFSTELEGRS